MSNERNFVRLMSAMHVFWYRLTDGLLGGTVMGAPMLLLTTVGHKSGREHTTPLLYLADGENWVVVASYGGSDHDPAWWLNLKENPQATVQVKGVQKTVRAQQASAKDKGRLWPLLTRLYPGYDDYQRRTIREIPVVVLRPEKKSQAKA